MVNVQSNSSPSATVNEVWSEICPVTPPSGDTIAATLYVPAGSRTENWSNGSGGEN